MGQFAGIGIDTLHIHLIHPNPDYPETLAGLLENVTRQTSERRGEALNGYFGNWFVVGGVRGVSLKGSLNKWLLGLGLPTDYPNVLQSIEKGLGLLFEGLGLPTGCMKDATVSRIDLFADLPMQQPPTSYYSPIAASKGKRRVVTDNTLYFNSGGEKGKRRRVVAFYDKGKESGKPDKMAANVLRFEVRYLKRVRQQLPPLGLHDLHSPQLHLKLMEKLKSEFDRLTITTNQKAHEGAKFSGLADFLGLIVSEKATLDSCLERLEQSKPLFAAATYSRTKKALREMFAKFKDNPEGGGVELTEKFRGIVSGTSETLSNLIQSDGTNGG